LLEVSYPPDYLYPFGIAVPIVATAIFSVSVLISNIISGVKKASHDIKATKGGDAGKKKNGEDTSRTESESPWKKYEVLIAFAGTAGTLFGGGIYSIIQFPLLDYQAYIIDNVNGQGFGKFDIILKNLGIKSATNIMVSAHVNNVTFKDLFSTPYLPENFKANIKGSNGYAKINVLPANAQIRITALVHTIAPAVKETITPFVYSEEGVGRVNQPIVIIFYVGLAGVFILLFIMLYVFIRDNDEIGIRFLAVGLIFILGYIGIFFGAYYLAYVGVNIQNISGLPSVKGLFH
jgi:hypothetical protein